MADPIKDLYKTLQQTGLFVDEADLRNQLRQSPRDVYSLVEKDGLFVDYSDFETALALKKKGAAPATGTPSGVGGVTSPTSTSTSPSGLPLFGTGRNVAKDKIGQQLQKNEEKRKLEAETPRFNTAIHLDQDLDREIGASLSDPSVHAPKDKTSLMWGYYQGKQQKFEQEKEYQKAQIKSDPKLLADYTRKRTAELDEEISRTERAQGALQKGAYGGALYVTDSKKHRELEEEKQRLTQYKGALQQSVAREAIALLAPQYLSRQAAPRDLGRALVDIADPDQAAEMRLAESEGAPLPGIRKAQLEQVGIESLRTYLQANLDLPEYEIMKAQLDQDEADFAERNFEFTAQGIREEIGAQLRRQGKQAWLGFGYDEAALREAFEATNPSEVKRRVFESYVLPTEQKIFGTNVPTGGFTKSAYNAVERSALGTVKTVQGLAGTRSDADRALESMSGEGQRYEAPKNRTGWQTVVDGMGDLTGQVAMMALTTKGLGATGTALKASTTGGLTGGLTRSTIGAVLASENVGLFLTSYLTSYDSYRTSAVQAMPQASESDRAMYARFMATVEGLSEKIFNDTKVLKAFTGKASPAIADITRRLSVGEITSQVAQKELSQAIKASAKTFGKEFAVSTGQNASEEAIVDVAEGIAQSVFGDKPLDMVKTGEQAARTFITTALHSPLIAGLAATGKVRQGRAQNAFFKASLVDMGRNPAAYLQAVEGLQLAGEITPEQAQEKVALIKGAAQALQNSPEGLDAPALSAYVLHTLNGGERSAAIAEGLASGTVQVTEDAEEVTGDKEVAEALDISFHSDFMEEELTPEQQADVDREFAELSGQQFPRSPAPSTVPQGTAERGEMQAQELTEGKEAQPMTVYHGTSYDIQKPTLDKYGQVHGMGGMLGRAIYVTPDKSEADYFADLSKSKNKGGKKKIIEGTLRAKNMISVTDLLNTAPDEVIEKWLSENSGEVNNEGVDVAFIRRKANGSANEKKLTNDISLYGDLSRLAELNGNDALYWGYEKGVPHEIAIVDEALFDVPSTDVSPQSTAPLSSTPPTNREEAERGETQPQISPDKKEEFREAILSALESANGSEFSEVISDIALQDSDRKTAVRNIRKGKKTVATKKVEEAIEKMWADGYVYLNRGRGDHSESYQMPIEEFLERISQNDEAFGDLSQQAQTLQASLDALGEDLFGETVEEVVEEVRGEAAERGEIQAGERPGNWSDERLTAEVEKLNPNESQGYNVVRNRELKEAMQENPERARLAFILRDFAARVWGNTFSKDWQKTPLSSLSMFYYSDANSLGEWVDAQIKGEEFEIESKQRYIDSLGNSKSDKQSKAFAEEGIASAKQRIEDMKKEFAAYQSEVASEKNNYKSPQSNELKTPSTPSQDTSTPPTPATGSNEETGTPGGPTPTDAGSVGSDGPRLEDLSGIKKALVPEAVRDQVDFARLTDTEMMARGRELIDSGVVKPRELINRIVTEGRGVLTPEEVVALIVHKADLDNALRAAYQKKNEALEKGEEFSGTADIQDLELQLYNYQAMSLITANNQSLAFRLRQQLLDSGYNALTQIERYKAANNGYIDPATEAFFREKAEAYQRTQDALRDEGEKIEAQEGAEAIQNIQEDLVRKGELSEQEVERRVQEGVQREIDKLYQALDPEKKSLADKALAALDKIQKNLRSKNYSDVAGAVAFIDAGITTIKNAIKAGVAVAKAVEMGVEQIKKAMGGTWARAEEFRRDMMEAFQQEGVETGVKPEPVARRNKKGELIIPPAIIRGFVKNGETTIEGLTEKVLEVVKDSVPDATARQVRDAITGYGREVNPTKDDLTTKLNQMRRVGKLISELEDLQAGIAREKNPAKKAKRTAQEEELLREIRALSPEVGREVDHAAKARREEERKLQAALDAAQESLNEYERRIRELDFSPKEKKQGPTSPELEDLRKKRDEKRKEYEELKKQQGPKKTDAQRLSEAKTRLRTRIKDLETRIAKGEYTKKKPQPVKADDEYRTLLKKADQLKDEIEKKQYEAKLKNRTRGEKIEDWAKELLNAMARALVAAGDLSFMLIQGGRRWYKAPAQSIRATGKAFQAYGREQWVRDFESAIKTDPMYADMKRDGVAFQFMDGKHASREDILISADVLNKVIDWSLRQVDKGVSLVSGGRISREQSHKATRFLNVWKNTAWMFNTYMNALRYQAYKEGYKKLTQKRGVTPESAPKDFKKMADNLNTLSSRASMGKMETSAEWLNILMFSARKVVSELKLYTPYVFVYYARMPKYVRKQAAGEFVQSVSTMVGLNALVWAMRTDWDDEDEPDQFWNPLSSNFLSHKVGTTYVDLTGGLRTMLVFQARLFMGEYTDSKGKTEKLGERFGKPINTRWNLVTEFGANKFAPTVSFAKRWADQRKGMEIDWTEEGKQLSTFMWMQDLDEIYNDHPGATATFLTSMAVMGAAIRADEERAVKAPETLKHNGKDVKLPAAAREKMTERLTAMQAEKKTALEALPEYQGAGLEEKWHMEELVRGRVKDKVAEEIKKANKALFPKPTTAERRAKIKEDRKMDKIMRKLDLD